MSDSSELPPLAQASAGAVGSLVSNTLSYPLDLVATRLQTQNSKGKGGKNKSGVAAVTQALHDIVEARGVKGLYQGLASDSLSNTLSNFLFFYFRGFFIEQLLSRKPATGSKSKAPSLTAPEDLACGLLAGIASRFFTTPLSAVTVRHQTSASASEKKGDNKEPEKKEDSDSEDEDGSYNDGPGIFETLQDIVKEKGVLGLWSGFETAALLSISPALTFYTSHILTQVFVPRASRDKPSALQVFAVNAAGSSVSTMVLYPLILSKSRLMWRSPSGRRQYRSLLDVLRKTVRRSGPAGLYQGWQSQIIKGLFSHGITMLVKSRVETLFVALFLLLRRNRQAAARAAAAATS